MSREDLSAMLAELAEDVKVPAGGGAARAWVKARTVRRRRAVIGAVVAVLLVSASITLWQLPRQSPAPADQPTPAPTVLGRARIDHLPPTIAAEPNAAPNWPATLEPPANAPSFAQAPLSHATLLFHPDPDGPIYAYGEGSINGGSGNGQFAWVRVDVPLVDTRDGGGNRATPLDVGSLGPMGQRAAFAQPDEFVVVDFRTGSVHRIPLAGLNEEVTWIIDGIHLLISGDTQTWLVGLDHVVGPVAVRGFDVTPLVGDATGQTTLTVASSQALVMRHYDDEGRAELSHRDVNMVGAAPYRIDYLAPRGWRMGSLIAQAASGQAGNQPDDFVVVVDEPTGAVTNVLDLGGGRNKGCCAVLGWMNPDVVLVRTEQDGVLAWRPSTGAVTRLAAAAPGMLSVAGSGCGSLVKVEGMTSACIA